MKSFVFWSPALLLAAVVLVSCAETGPVADSRPRFHEAASTDVVLRFNRWEHINITQPEYREDGFLVQLSGSTLGPAFDRLLQRRELAVVVLGWTYTPDELRRLVADWGQVLRRYGFKRIVCVQAGRDNDVDGLPIIDDTMRSDVAVKQTAGS